MQLIRDNAARPVPRPLIIEMGGKNPAHHHAHRPISTRPPTASCGRHSARRARSAPPARASTSTDDSRRVRAAARREDEEDQDRQPARSRRLPGTGHQRRRGEDLRTAVAQATRDGGTILTGGRAADRRRVRARLLRRADDHRRTAARPSAVLRRAVRADHRPRRRDDARRGDRPGEPHRVRPDRRHLLRGRSRDSSQFFERIQAGVTYANRRAGATTGAWPGINSFGGWKASGSTGRGTGGPYYVQQFMREQSRVRIR